jgi:hypothetical protein
MSRGVIAVVVAVVVVKLLFNLLLPMVSHDVQKACDGIQVGRHRKEDIEKGRSGAARHNTSFKTHPTICKSIPLLFRKNDPTFQTPITLFSGADHTIQGTIPLSHYYNIIPLTLFSSFPLHYA